ncbi:ATP-grasp domain-containing protein, partial [Candidatus Uhrbacteria bacterium]|nr:ATP-grasp domain-containing protein [Candidatus Uhrbacteria bacterium]
MSNKKQHILITCGGGSASIYLARRLTSYNVFLSDADSVSVAKHLGYPFAPLPFGNKRGYQKALDTLVRRWNINVIVPGADEELLSVRDYCDKNPETIAVLPSKEFIRMCLNKGLLMKRLAQENISHLLPYQSLHTVRFPLLAKPNQGRGSRFVHRLENRVQLRGYFALYGLQKSDVLLQPFIGGTEYTISVIVNNKNKIVGIVPKRVIKKRGITHVAVSEKSAPIETICKKIVARLRPAGPFNVQLKIWKNRIYIFEINPRLSTTTVLTDQVFGNEVGLYLHYYNTDRI